MRRVTSRRRGWQFSRRMLTSTAAVLSALFLIESPAGAVMNIGTPQTTWYASDYQNNFGQHSKIRVPIYFDRQPNTVGMAPGFLFLGNQFFGHIANSGGYIGIQYFPDGSRRFIFSVWNAIGVYCAETPNVYRCGPFSGEGSGYQAISTVGRGEFQNGVQYSFVVQYGWTDANGNSWYNADLVNDWTGATRPIGSMLVPPGYGLFQGAVSQWNEEGYFDSATSCSQFPYVNVWRGPVYFDGVLASSHASSLGGNPPPGACLNRVYDWNGGVVHEYGGYPAS